MDKMLYTCNPDKHIKCKKTACHRYGGECYLTTEEMYASNLMHDNILVQDQLHVMLETQKKFQNRVDPRYKSDDLKERAAFIRDHFTHCVQELGEMLQEVPFYKNWKDYSKMTDVELLEAFDMTQKELVDAWDFFMNLILASGMDATIMYQRYCSKHEENIRRQDEGYDYTMKHVGGKINE